MLKKTLTLLTFTLALLLNSVQFAYAADTLTEGSLGISPFLIDTTILPGNAAEYEITVFNVSEQPLPITVSINDFVPSPTGSGARFLETNEAARKEFSLASWINITEQPEFLIAPKGKTVVRFRIQVPIDAEPGTHYGGLLFSTRNEDSGPGATTVIRKIGAIILVSSGTTDPIGAIESFTSSKKFYKSPTASFTSIFTNEGNVHLAPKGQIQIQNILGRTVGEAYFNKDGQIVLPQSSRTFGAAFHKPWMFGRYTANLTYWYGNPRLEARSSVIFWVFPFKLIGTVGGIGMLSLLMLYFGIRRYNAWIIKKHS